MTNADAKTSERYMVLLEQIQSQVQVIAESHGQLDLKIESVRSELIEFKADVGIFIKMTQQRFDGMDKCLAGVEKRLDGVGLRLDGVERRLEGIDIKLDRVCSDVDRHNTVLRKKRLLQ